MPNDQENSFESKAIKIDVTDEKGFVTNPLYLDVDFPENIVIDDKSKKLLELGEDLQRYTIVGWIIDDKIHLRFRPGFPSSVDQSTIEYAEKRFGKNNFVIAKKSQPGIVHADLIKQVEAEEPELSSVTDPIKGQHRVIRKMIGLSVIKGSKNSYAWLNRSALNISTFKRDSLAVACNLFPHWKENLDRAGTHNNLLDYNVNRSIPARYFIPLIDKASALITNKVQTKGKYTTSGQCSCYSFEWERMWNEIGNNQNVSIKKDRIRSLIQKNIYIIAARAPHEKLKNVSGCELQVKNAIQAAIDNNIKLNLDYIPAFSPYPSQTALMHAAIKGYASLVKILLNPRYKNIPAANINARDNYGETALHQAAAAGQLDIVRILLAHNADKTILSNSGLDYLASLAEGIGTLTLSSEKNYETIKEILTMDGVKKYISSSSHQYGRVALKHAIRQKDARVFKLLLEYGADPLIDEETRNYLAIFAEVALDFIIKDRTEKALCIFDELKAVTPIFKDKINLIRYGQTPLNQAAISGNVELIKRLLQHGANPNIKTGEFSSSKIILKNCWEHLSVHVARLIGSHDFSTVELIMKEFPEVKKSLIEYYSENYPLHTILAKEKFTMADWLIKNGIFPAGENEIKMTKYFHDLKNNVSIDDHKMKDLTDFINVFDFSYLHKLLGECELKTGNKILISLKEVAKDILLNRAEYSEVVLSDPALLRIVDCLNIERQSLYENIIHHLNSEFEKIEVSKIQSPIPSMINEVKSLITEFKSGDNWENHFTKLQNKLKNISLKIEEISNSNNSITFYKKPLLPEGLDNIIKVVRELEDGLLIFENPFMLQKPAIKSF